MERLGDYVKQSVLNFKLELCCFCASVRVGVLAFACLNVIICCVILIALAEENFKPLLLQTLNGMAEEPPNFVPTCIIAYAVDLASGALLLCAIIREDLVLLRVYLYYALGVLTLAVMVYSVVFMALSLALKFLIIGSVGHQIYLILLVRSAMVEIKQASIKNGYIVNLRKNIEPFTPVIKAKYSVVIETDGKKTPVASLVRKEIKADVNEETLAKPKFKESATLPIHLATRQEKSAVPAKETSVHLITKKVIDKESNPKEVAKKGAVIKAELTNVGVPKEEVSKKGGNKEGADKEEVSKERERKEGVRKEGVSKEGVNKEGVSTEEVSNEGITKEGVTKDGKKKAGANKDGVNKEAKKEEIKNPFRGFFGRKEKVKIEESKAKLEKIEESKKD